MKQPTDSSTLLMSNLIIEIKVSIFKAIRYFKIRQMNNYLWEIARNNYFGFIDLFIGADVFEGLHVVTFV